MMPSVWTEAIAAMPGETIFKDAASALVLREAEQQLGQALPAELAALLAESDGVEGEYGLGLVWSIERIVAENLALRRDADLASLYMPFDSLLFFGDAGNGDLFGLVPHNGRPDVFAWNHEDDSRTWVARGLAAYLDGWLSGRITV
jgi:SMI1-KNR4 cell-wall